jgi:Glycosyl hydrolase family 26
VVVRRGRRRVVARFRISRKPAARTASEIASSTGARLRWSPTVPRAGRAIVVRGGGFGRRRLLLLSGVGDTRRLRASRRGRFSARVAVPRIFLGARHLVVRPARRRAWRLGVRIVAPTVLFGAYVNSDAEGGQSRREVSAFEELIGRRLAVGHHYRPWASSFDLSDGGEADEGWDVESGRIPLISHGDGQYQSSVNILDAIRNGSQDGVITSAARAIRGLGRPVFYRPLWEMNADWNSYNITKASTPGTADGTRKFVEAWRRMHGIFRREGAVNAAFVWCPNAQDNPDTAANHWTRYYPGHAYVDWVCADGYNRGRPRRSFAEIFGPVHRDYPRKPFMVGETGSVESGGSKAGWINDARAQMKTNLRGIKAFLWFQRGRDTSDDGVDWRVNTSRSALAAFRALVADPYFRD